MTGPVTRPMATSGGASSSTARSGPAIERFLGIISPATTCRYVTIDRAMTSDTGWIRTSGRCTAWKSGSSRCAMAGSATAPSPSEHSVTPSWHAASMSETCSMAARAERARALVWARGSIWLRRADSTANSAPTKKAFPRIRNTARTSEASLLTRHLPSWGRGTAG